LIMTDGIYLLLGSNLGDRRVNLKRARYIVEKKIGKIRDSSSIFVTEAWGKRDQPIFLNQVILIKSNLAPLDLLAGLQTIELKLGRIRHETWGERIIDIDILYYNDLVLKLPSLTIPHPEIPNRRFTLAPLAALAPDFIHPVLCKTNAELLDICQDMLAVRIDEQQSIK
jgi:2-amino-4-hydroxy-6-hydroxymethyldihydropteridine diphosphokinase